MSALVLLVLATAAPADYSSAEATLRLASSAFEYRDFEKVIELVQPLMHPVVLIPGEAQQVAARRLLAVSHHVNGDMDRARDEFSHLLLMDPKYKLDPTTIPPAVIEDFEELRDDMRPVLDALLLERRKKNEPPDRATMFLPVGVPQFKLKHWEAGYVLGSLQVVGLAINVAGWAVVKNLDAYDRTREDALAVMYGGLATWLSAYLASVIIGNALYTDG